MTAERTGLGRTSNVLATALAVTLLVAGAPSQVIAGPWNGYSRDAQITILQQGLQDQASRNAANRMWDNILSVPPPAFPLFNSPYSQENQRALHPRTRRYSVPSIPPDIQIMKPEPGPSRRSASSRRRR